MRASLYKSESGIESFKELVATTYASLSLSLSMKTPVLLNAQFFLELTKKFDAPSDSLSSSYVVPLLFICTLRPPQFMYNDD